MTNRLAISCFVLAMTYQAAAAGPVEDCVPLSPSVVILRACSEIADGKNFTPEQKAIAFRYRGIVRLSSGAVRPAIADFTDSLKFKKDASTYAGRGWARFTDRDLQGAIADYREAIRLSPNNAGYYRERGHINIVAEQLDDAVRDLTQALRLDPKNAEAFNTRGYAYAKQGNFARAKEDYNSAIKLGPFVAVFYANRGYLYEAQGRDKDAIDDLKHALQLDPSLVEAMNALKRLKAVGPGSGESSRRVSLGKEVAEKHCGRCHAVGERDVSPVKDATEFRNLARRHPNLSLRTPIERAIAVTHDAMPSFNLSSEEIESIIAYIDAFVTR